MDIALIGPKEITEFDKQEIEGYIEELATDYWDETTGSMKQNHIHFLAYRSIETEVFSFFIENEHLAERLTIYTFQSFDHLPKNKRMTIQFLIDCGANHVTYDHNDILIKRTMYTYVWKDIIDASDSVISFYDNQKTSLLIPIDIAKSQRKKAYIYSLPGMDEAKFELGTEKKLKSVL